MLKELIQRHNKKEGQAFKEQFSYPGNFEILTPKGFFNDFVEYGYKAQHRLWAQSMYAEYGNVFNLMATTLVDAKSRGLNTALNLDYYSYMVEGQQTVLLAKLGNPLDRETERRLYAKQAVLQSLQEEGVCVTITNPANKINSLVPFKGRNHIKLAIADNIAWVGGISYRDDDLEKEDFMMRFTDPTIVSVLADQFHRVNENKGKDDTFLACNHETAVMVDRGHPGDSIILDAALGIIKNARHNIKLITQYTPNGIVSDALYDSYLYGVDVKVFTSMNKSISEWFGKTLDSVNMVSTAIHRNGLPHLRSTKRVHAKALLVDSGISGRESGIIGSHNFVETGVSLGTQELSVISYSPQFIDSLSNYFSQVEDTITNSVKT